MLTALHDSHSIVELGRVINDAIDLRCEDSEWRLTKQQAGLNEVGIGEPTTAVWKPFTKFPFGSIPATNETQAGHVAELATTGTRTPATSSAFSVASAVQSESAQSLAVSTLQPKRLCRVPQIELFDRGASRR